MESRYLDCYLSQEQRAAGLWLGKSDSIVYRAVTRDEDSFAGRGHVAELADALDLGSNGAIRAGSIPVVPTIPVCVLCPDSAGFPILAALLHAVSLSRLFISVNQFGLGILAAAVSAVAAGALPQDTAALSAKAPLDDVAHEIAWRHGTLAVVVVESSQVVVAIDSRWMRTQFDRADVVEDGHEKFVPLTSHVGFFNTGVGEFTNNVTGNSISVVKEAKAAANDASGGTPPSVVAIANEYRKRVEEKMSRLSMSELRGIHVGALRLQQPTVFQSVFAGRDPDGAFSLFRVTCSTALVTNFFGVEVRTEFKVVNEKDGKPQQVLFFGATGAFADVVTNAHSPLTPIFKNLKARRHLVAEPAAAALVDMGIRNHSGERNPAGYPIFVYRVDAAGIRRTRVINQGDPVPFLPPGR